MPFLRGNLPLTRRKFLIALECLAGMSIVGSIVAPKAVERLAEKPSHHPALLDCLQLSAVQGGVALYDASEPGRTTLVCEVNDVGGAILGAIDGQRAVEEIAQAALRTLGRECADRGAFVAKTALFLAQLAEAGFLQQPFFVDVTETSVVS